MSGTLIVIGTAICGISLLAGGALYLEKRGRTVKALEDRQEISDTLFEKSMRDPAVIAELKELGVYLDAVEISDKISKSPKKLLIDKLISQEKAKKLEAESVREQLKKLMTRVDQKYLIIPSHILSHSSYVIKKKYVLWNDGTVRLHYMNDDGTIDSFYSGDKQGVDIASELLKRLTKEVN